MSLVEHEILVVEDEAELREIIVALLKIDHFSVDEVQDGVAGLELLSKNQYSLVLTDIQMPRMTGLELFAAAKAKGIPVPFVFLTAYGDQENIMKALRLGAFDFIKKPFDETEVREVVNRANEVGYRRMQIQKNQNQAVSLTSEKINRDQKMIQLIEIKNAKSRP